MKLGRGLAVMFWFVVFGGIGLLAPWLGGELMTKEFNLLIAFIVAWCNDD